MKQSDRDYRNKELSAVLKSGDANDTAFYRLVISADVGIATKHLNVTEEEVIAIREILSNRFALADIASFMYLTKDH